jgi:hypothetical protein
MVLRWLSSCKSHVPSTTKFISLTHYLLFIWWPRLGLVWKHLFSLVHKDFYSWYLLLSSSLGFWLVIFTPPRIGELVHFNIMLITSFFSGWNYVFFFFYYYYWLVFIYFFWWLASSSPVVSLGSDIAFVSGTFQGLGRPPVCYCYFVVIFSNSKVCFSVLLELLFMFALCFFRLRTLCWLPFSLVWPGSSCVCVKGFSSGVMGLEYNYGCLVPRASGWPV